MSVPVPPVKLSVPPSPLKVSPSLLPVTVSLPMVPSSVSIFVPKAMAMLLVRPSKLENVPALRLTVDAVPKPERSNVLPVPVS